MEVVDMEVVDMEVVDTLGAPITTPPAGVRCPGGGPAVAGQALQRDLRSATAGRASPRTCPCRGCSGSSPSTGLICMRAYRGAGGGGPRPDDLTGRRIRRADREFPPIDAPHGDAASLGLRLTDP